MQLLLRCKSELHVGQLQIRAHTNRKERVSNPFRGVVCSETFPRRAAHGVDSAR